MSLQELQTLQEQIATLTVEVRELKTLLVEKNKTFCTSQEALVILGVNNPRYLTYFHTQNLLSRRPGKKGFSYSISELNELNNKIKNFQVRMPKASELYKQTS